MTTTSTAQPGSGQHERTVLEISGVVIRYGRFYGPGTYFQSDLPSAPRVHIDDAAAHTVPALTARSGTLVIADDPSD
jgi:hypothetical protein